MPGARRLSSPRHLPYPTLHGWEMDRRPTPSNSSRVTIPSLPSAPVSVTADCRPTPPRFRRIPRFCKPGLRPASSAPPSSSTWVGSWFARLAGAFSVGASMSFRSCSLTACCVRSGIWRSARLRGSPGSMWRFRRDRCPTGSGKAKTPEQHQGMRIWIHRLLDRLRLATAAFRLRETWRSLKGTRRPVAAPDGFPLPPPKLMVLVTGSADTCWYTEGGRLGVESICRILDQAGARPGDLHSVLDFGCGCGRVIRYWRALTSAQLYGTDSNPRLVDWCRRNLPFAKFQSNTLEPRLNYADHQFEFAYALSVLTHTPEDQQQPWMNELWRILRPRGYLLITTQGDEFLPKLTED